MKHPTITIKRLFAATPGEIIIVFLTIEELFFTFSKKLYTAQILQIKEKETRLQVLHPLQSKKEKGQELLIEDTALYLKVKKTPLSGLSPPSFYIFQNEIRFITQEEMNSEYYDELLEKVHATGQKNVYEIQLITK